MQNKFFRLERTAFLMFLSVIIISGFVLNFAIYKFHFIYVILLIAVWSCFIFFMKHLKHLGFEGKTLTPNTFAVQAINYEKIKQLLTGSLHSEMKIINDVPDEKESYMLTKYHGLNLRIILLGFDDFNKDIFKSKKAKVNRLINMENNIKQTITISDNGKYMRINIMVMHKPNEYSTYLSNQNADMLLSRVEGILNIFIFEEEGVICFPAHFGWSKFKQYFMIYRNIEKLIKKWEVNKMSEL